MHIRLSLFFYSRTLSPIYMYVYIYIYIHTHTHTYIHKNINIFLSPFTFYLSISVFSSSSFYLSSSSPSIFLFILSFFLRGTVLFFPFFSGNPICIVFYIVCQVKMEHADVHHTLHTLPFLTSFSPSVSECACGISVYCKAIRESSKSQHVSTSDQRRANPRDPVTVMTQSGSLGYT